MLVAIDFLRVEAADCLLELASVVKANVEASLERQREIVRLLLHYVGLVHERAHARRQESAKGRQVGLGRQIPDLDCE